MVRKIEREVRLVSNFVKFTPALITNLEKKLIFSKETRFEEILERLRYKKRFNKVIPIEDFYVLEEVKGLSPEKYVYCFLDSEDDLNKIVKVKGAFFERVEVLKLNLELKEQAKINTSLRERNGYYIPLVYFNRIEFLLDTIFKGYIDEELSVRDANMVMGLTDGLKREVIYKVARRLSTKYNYGYKLMYESSSIVLEKGERVVFSWRDTGVFCGGKEICKLYDGIKFIADCMNSKYINEMRLRDEKVV